MSTSRTARAFTLIELIMVVLIMGIIGAILVPAISGTHDAQCAAASRVLTATLELAQGMSMSRQAEVAVVFSEELQRFKVALVEEQNLDDFAGLTALEHPEKPGMAYEVQLAVEQQLRSLEILAVNFGGQRYVIFDSFGSPHSGGEILLRAGEVQYRLQVESITGAISVSSAG